MILLLTFLLINTPILCYSFYISPENLVELLINYENDYPRNKLLEKPYKLIVDNELDDNNDESEENIDDGELITNKILRTGEEDKKTLGQKRDEIARFLVGNRLSTNYFYQEMQRIKKDGGKVYNDLQFMVKYLDNHPKKNYKSLVLNFFNRLMSENKKLKKNIYDFKVNDLFIDILNDQLYRE